MKNFYQWYRKHITGASMLFFLATTVIASFVGLVIPRMIHLGKGVSFEMATSDI